MSEQILSLPQLIDLIPNRPPYLLLDRVRIDEPGRRATGVKNVTLDEPYFCGHFPAHPIMPGVLQVEAMTQLAYAILYAAEPDRAGVPFVHAMRRVKFRQPVTPGDQLIVEAELEPGENGRIAVKASTTCGDKVTSEAELEVGFIEDAGAFEPRELAPPLKLGEAETAMDIVTIMGIIPHRFPFLLIDRVLEVELADDGVSGSFIGLKNISVNEPILNAYAGAGAPCLPSSLIPEIAAQAGCAFVLSLEQNLGKLAYFMSIDEMQVFRPIVPGDRLQINTTISIRRGRFGRGEADIYVGDELVATSEIKFTVADND